MAPHTISATSEQMTALLNFMDEHKELARGRLRSTEGKVEARRLWAEICEHLNTMDGGIKSVQQWQKVWFDRKHLAKKAAAESRRSAAAAGWGPSSSQDLSQWETKILSIMGDGFGDCQASDRTPAFELSLTEESPSLPLDLNVTEEVVVPSLPTTSLPASSQRAHRFLSSRSLPRSIPRRRVPAAVEFRRRMYQYEEERAERENRRNIELAGIKEALQELCRLVKRFLD